MKKIFIVSAIILLSAIAASAQSKAKTGKPALVRNKEEVQIALAASRNVRKEDARVLRLGPSTTYLAKGLSVGDVIRAMGNPTSVSEEQEGDTRRATYIFPRSGDHVIVAKFENGLLVSSDTKTAEELTQDGQ